MAIVKINLRTANAICEQIKKDFGGLIWAGTAATGSALKLADLKKHLEENNHPHTVERE